MKQYKKDFIDFIMESGVLTFGEFITKSGRKTPFFVNTGNFKTGKQLKKLGEYYATAIYESFGDSFDVLFGPAYKGIPLSVVTAIELNQIYGLDISYCSNRKEIKDHGDKGILLGARLKEGDRVLIIEDVITAGTSIHETMPIIKAQGAIEVVGLVISVDRMERGKGTSTALNEISGQYGFKASSIVTMAEVGEYLYDKGILDNTIKKAIDEYYKQYGI